jgi:hypothetical protein
MISLPRAEGVWPRRFQELENRFVHTVKVHQLRRTAQPSSHKAFCP